jgi:predicted transcriptional regulator
VIEQERALLLSIRPRFAESIVAGTKRAEIRRQRLGVQAGTPVIIYATLPVAAVIGTARIAEVTEGTPAEMWALHKTQVGLNRAEFDSYLEGAATACILLLADARRLTTPLTLEQLRTTEAFQPPQSYLYLTRSRLHKLVNGHPGGGPLLDLMPAKAAMISLF